MFIDKPTTVIEKDKIVYNANLPADPTSLSVEDGRYYLYQEQCIGAETVFYTVFWWD